MATLVESTIGVGGTYPDLPTWWASVPADLVAADQIHKGKLLKPKLTVTSTFTMTSKTTSASCYPELTADVGASWIDDPSYGTGPMRYDPSKGATIETVSASVQPLIVSCKFARITRLQFGSMGTGASIASALRVSADDVTVEDCIGESYAINSAAKGTLALVGRRSTVRRGLFAQRRPDIAAIIAQIGNDARLEDVTLVSLGATLTVGMTTQNLASTLTRVYVGGVAAPDDGTVASTKVDCATNATATGWTTVPLDTANFVNITPGTHDLRIKQGSALDTANAGLQTPLYAPPADNAPVLSNAAASPLSATSGAFSVATDEAGGTLYRYISIASAAPNAATIKAASLTQTVAATGTQSAQFEGLAAGTTYYVASIQTDSAGQDSNIVTASFTTPAADAVKPTFSGGAAITAGTITSSSVAGSYPAASDNVGVHHYEKSKDGGAFWEDNGSGLTFQFNGLAASTAHAVRIRAVDAAGNFSDPLTLTMTTSASQAPTGSFTTSRGLEYNSATPWPQGTVVHWEWRQNGRIGSAPTSTTYGTATVASDGKVTATGLPSGPGILMVGKRGATFMNDYPYYEPGTVA
ncbi:hypothetical protein [Massilia sp. DD77]|uniref:hypothetical protein n=1 Tax=Massilia sp. DD77 TaxID=3109349 RepID=UPI0030008BF2